MRMAFSEGSPPSSPSSVGVSSPRSAGSRRHSRTVPFNTSQTRVKPDWRNLIESDLTVDHQRVRRSKPQQAFGHGLGLVTIGHADHLTTSPGRIRQWPDQIHDGGNPKFTPDCRHMAHGRVIVRREQKDDPDVA